MSERLRRDADVLSLTASNDRLRGEVHALRAELATAKAERDALLAYKQAWDDEPLPEDAAIAAAHPTRSGRHDLYAEAMRLVGAKRSKGALVALVNWLLQPGASPAK